MEISTAQAIKLAIISATGLSRDALHIYFGMAVFVVLTAMNKRLRPYLAWLCVLAMACLVELVDWHDDLHSYGYWRWRGSVHDILNTLCWPSVLTFFWYLRHRSWRMSTTSNDRQA